VQNQTPKLKTERLPGGLRKFIAPVNNNIETCEHLFLLHNYSRKGRSTPILWLSKILHSEGGYDKDTYKERHSSDKVSVQIQMGHLTLSFNLVYDEGRATCIAWIQTFP